MESLGAARRGLAKQGKGFMNDKPIDNTFRCKRCGAALGVIVEVDGKRQLHHIGEKSAATIKVGSITCLTCMTWRGWSAAQGQKKPIDKEP